MAELIDKNEKDSQVHNHEDKEKHFVIFINRLKFDEHHCAKKEMTPDEIAQLVGMTGEIAIVRRVHGHDSTDPLEGVQEILRGDHFSVTRRAVKGGYIDRVQSELSRLREGLQEVDFVQGSNNQSCVVYRALPSHGTIHMLTDVLVQVPNGYPASTIDMAALPADSPLIGRVEGSPQGTIEVDGQTWRLISYHPHNGGGAPPWNLAVHGFHTYLAELLSWLEVRK